VLEELSDHIMDIAMNSVRAGAKNVFVSVVASAPQGTLSITIGDDGAGMGEEALKKVSDPFYSTKDGKKVGLGVSLLKGAAEMCGGEFRITSAPGKGTEIEALFSLDHPDVPPLGNVKETMLLLCVTNPEVRFSFRLRAEGKDFDLDTKEINDILGGLPINHPEVVTFLTRYIEGGA
jgi:signal transduction histidine kinase